MRSTPHSIGAPPIAVDCIALWRLACEPAKEETMRYQSPVLLLIRRSRSGGLLPEEDISAVLPLSDQIEVHRLHGVGHRL